MSLLWTFALVVVVVSVINNGTIVVGATQFQISVDSMAKFQSALNNASIGASPSNYFTIIFSTAYTWDYSSGSVLSAVLSFFYINIHAK